MIFSPDISKYLDYLADGGYIEFSGKRVNAYNVYRKDGVVQLTKKRAWIWWRAPSRIRASMSKTERRRTRVNLHHRPPPG